ncbi:hypothetical protein CLOSTMETH_01128 [[Clostridium] methylpentosum DSM 5476]|uniref:Uncharacterized protein n=1 Tax=[Clostridium] methylpentosum DSM 5476 TaxID=537013 RepID=C0EBB0_9FIRM|nr:hypothetical protein CLOSTMETH_01128 [[Clostridium] methylpentosum DSM 5476]
MWPPGHLKLYTGSFPSLFDTLLFYTGCCFALLGCKNQNQH